MREAGLLSAGDSSEIATGSIAISAADGVAAVTIGGKPVLRSQLEALGTSPITIDTGEGSANADCLHQQRQHWGRHDGRDD